MTRANTRQEQQRCPQADDATIVRVAGEGFEGGMAEWFAGSVCVFSYVDDVNVIGPLLEGIEDAACDANSPQVCIGGEEDLVCVVGESFDTPEGAV